MPLITLLLVIIVAGVLLWLVQAYIPMAPPVKTILTAVVVLCLVLFILSAFGVLPALESVRVGPPARR